MVVAVIYAWEWMGLSMPIYLAGLKTIDEDTLEAARLDGAGPWLVFRPVRFPLRSAGRRASQRPRPVRQEAPGCARQAADLRQVRVQHP